MQPRRATTSDAEAFVAVLIEVAEENRWIGTEPGFDVAERTARVRGWIDAGDALWVLEHGGEVVGMLGLHPTHARGVLSLGMSIAAHARGGGGGRALMEAALAHLAAADDVHKVELEVWPDNAPAIALYTRYGFEVEGLRRDHYRRRDGSLRSSLIMARLLRG